MICFDDGPCELTERVLDVLADHGVKASFALVGARVLERPAIARRIAADGHRIVNHTMHHRRLIELDLDDVVSEVRGCEEAILEATGVQTSMLRPPFAVLTEAGYELCEKLGYTVLGGSSMGDYLYDDPNELALAARGHRGFLGLHDTHPVTVEALPAILVGHRELVAA